MQPFGSQRVFGFVQIAMQLQSYYLRSTSVKLLCGIGVAFTISRMVLVRAWTFGEFVLDHLCRASGSREEILRIKEEVCTTMGNHLIVIMWELDLMQELTAHQETSTCFI